jgi:hypothetical protein
LVPGDDPDVWVELDIDGTPLGEWHWDEDLQDWIFVEYPPPLGNLPRTGDNSGEYHLLILLGAVVVGIVIDWYFDERREVGRGK